MASDYQPVHRLSKKARKNGWNLFLWGHSATAGTCMRLHGGINLGRFHFLTTASLCRWIGLFSSPTDTFDLRPINVVPDPGGFLAYFEQKTNLPALNDKPFEHPIPGDYAAFRNAQSPPPVLSPWCYNADHPEWSRALVPLKGAPTMQKMNESEFKHAHAHLDVMPDYMEDLVRKRSHSCSITGRHDSGVSQTLSVVWIVHPTHCRFASDFFSSYSWTETEDEIKTFVVPENAILLRPDVAGAFRENAFGIDVDDNYRIVQFIDLPALELPSHVPEAQKAHLEPSADKFLRFHFMWCLRVNICGGHVMDDFDRGEVLGMMEELGLTGSGSEMAPVTDPRWKTEIGKICWEMAMNSRFASDKEKDKC
ncbi:hypothetical protein SISNIDRAFT_487827 [Sistotremastrum niveocremeum HHB9708]|uniref:HNH nuclease domain-containing protein n=1 Tax=Sistotremastrum niveocremeum HHB9708 TaxID=1314777 RepID=A0A164S424_9AGAM|nr:hypothetical protein SISNIDRAFT_487827 [Sistotremastrum niveocremeum HHB9708]